MPGGGADGCPRHPRHVPPSPEVIAEPLMPGGRSRHAPVLRQACVSSAQGHRRAVDAGGRSSPAGAIAEPLELEGGTIACPRCVGQPTREEPPHARAASGSRQQRKGPPSQAQSPEGGVLRCRSPCLLLGVSGHRSGLWLYHEVHGQSVDRRKKFHAAGRLDSLFRAVDWREKFLVHLARSRRLPALPLTAQVQGDEAVAHIAGR